MSTTVTARPRHRARNATATPGGSPGSTVLDALVRVAAEMVGITAMAVAQAATTNDLTLAQWRALVVVASSEGMHVGEIAERIGGSVPSASRLIRRLERRGLVTTERDEADRRATIVRSTPEGAKARVSVMTRRRELLAEALHARPDPLPEALDAGLEAIADALEHHA